MTPSKIDTPPQSLQIRVIQDGSKLHIRADAYVSGEHVGHCSERETITMDLTAFPASTTAQVVRALHAVFCQEPLF